MSPGWRDARKPTNSRRARSLKNHKHDYKRVERASSATTLTKEREGVAVASRLGNGESPGNSVI